MGDYYGHGGGGTTTKPATTQQQHSSAPGSSLQHSDHSKIFVGGLSWQTTEESLRWHFEQYGQVISVEVMRDRVTGDPRGFAFVVFAEGATVDLVMKDKDKHEINHKFVDVKRAQARGVAPPSIHHEKDETTSQQPQPQQQQPQSSSSSQNTGQQQPSPEQMHCKVFVGGIPPQVDRDELKQIFEQFGTVSDAIVMMDQTFSRSRGFGFVTFAVEQGNGGGSAAAQRAIQAQPVPIHGRNVEVKLATPREGQPTTNSHHHHNNANKNRPQGVLPKYMGLRAGQASSVSTGEFAGLAVAYGRSGWKAGYGTKAFGKAGWNVFEDTGGTVPDKAGFSFDMLQQQQQQAVKVEEDERPSKRARN